MTRIRLQTLLALFALSVIGLIAAIGGLYVYVRATTKPLHPDPANVPTSTAATPPPGWAAAVERAQQIARDGLTDQNLPALSLAVGVGGELVWAEALGWADIDSQVRATPGTRFRVGEPSKALTSAAVGLLLEQGKLTLDDEIQRYVPEYPKKQWPLTLRQLMGQVGGLPDDGGDEASLEPCERTGDGLRLFADGKLQFEPGTRYQPSSYGWILVSAAIEHAADERFYRFMRSRIFEPLGMSATRVDSSDESIAERATFYHPRFGGETRYGPESTREGDHSCYAGGGGFLSTPSDLVRFGMAFEGGKVVKPDTVSLLQTSLRLPSGEETGHGLGWRLETLPLAGDEVRMAGHATKSDFLGGSTYLMTFPDRAIVVAVMSNTAFADLKTVALSVADVFAAQAKARSGK